MKFKYEVEAKIKAKTETKSAAFECLSLNAQRAELDDHGLGHLDERSRQ